MDADVHRGTFGEELITKKTLLVLTVVLVLNSNANATPGAASGAIVFGGTAAIVCDHLARTYFVVASVSDEPWYHVGADDLAGLAAGTICAIPASVAGAAIGVAVETTVVGTTVTAAGAGAGVAAGVAASKGLHVAWRAMAGPVKGAIVHFRSEMEPTRQWLGQKRFSGSVAPSTALRAKHMKHLYGKQGGMDAICNVPLPPLYVGAPWNRRLNPDIEIDHRIPKAKGGSDDVANLQLTYRYFNRAKGDRTGNDLRRARLRFCPV